MSPSVLLALISAIIPVANNLITWIEKATSAVKQSAELSPADLDALAQIESSKSWNIDPDPAPPVPPIP